MTNPSYDEIEFQYEDVERQLSDPEVVADQAKYKDLTQRYTELKEFVEKYRLFKSLHQHRLDAEEMLNDPEMKDMAKEELDDIDQQLRSIDEDLQLFLVFIIRFYLGLVVSFEFLDLFAEEALGSAFVYRTVC